MKIIIPIVLIVLFVFACSKEEKKLELFSPEAFAYSLDNGWELNASCQIKGFEKKEIEGMYKAKIYFELDLKTPNGVVKKNIQQGFVDQTEKEDVMDLPFNTQIVLDTTYKSGKYVLIFNAKDNYSNKTSRVEKEFEF